MQPIDTSTQERTLPEAILEEVQQPGTQVRGLHRTFVALRHHNYRLFFLDK